MSALAIDHDTNEKMALGTQRAGYSLRVRACELPSLLLSKYSKLNGTTLGCPAELKTMSECKKLW